MKLIADRMLGKLAKLLRILGFDTLYSKDIPLGELLRIGREEERIILTRRTIMEKQGEEYKYLFITDNNPKGQLKEVLKGLDLKIHPEMAFTRCVQCNCRLKKMERNHVKGSVPDYIYETHRDFSYCAFCGKVFWKGTHYENMLRSFGILHLPVYTSLHIKLIVIGYLLLEIGKW